MIDYPKELKKDFQIYMIKVGSICVFFAVLIFFISLYPVDALPFNASQPGERNPGDPYQFTMHNVSGTYENVTHHITVYSSKLFPKNQSYQYWSVLYGQWMNQTPEKNKKWLFVWVEDYTEGATTWSYEKDRFTVWIWGNTTIPAEPVQLEDHTSYPDKHKGPAIIQGVTYGHTVSRDYSWFGDPYGWRDGYIQPRVEPGRSNAWSGWIRYQVPDGAMLQDLQLAGWFDNFGSVQWNLVKKNITPVTVTPGLTITPVQLIKRINENSNVNPVVTQEETNGRNRA